MVASTLNYNVVLPPFYQLTNQQSSAELQSWTKLLGTFIFESMKKLRVHVYNIVGGVGGRTGHCLLRKCDPIILSMIVNLEFAVSNGFISFFSRIRPGLYLCGPIRALMTPVTRICLVCTRVEPTVRNHFLYSPWTLSLLFNRQRPSLGSWHVTLLKNQQSPTVSRQKPKPMKWLEKQKENRPELDGLPILSRYMLLQVYAYSGI